MRPRHAGQRAYPDPRTENPLRHQIGHPHRDAATGICCASTCRRPRCEPKELPELLRGAGGRRRDLPKHRGQWQRAWCCSPTRRRYGQSRPDFASASRPALSGFRDRTGRQQDVASRVFAAYHGIDEDPVTGSAHAALVPFWAERLGRNRFTALQASKRTGLLDCELRGDRVILGGHAVTVIEGYFQI